MEMEMEMESSASRPLELFFIPFLSPGHMIPLCEMARRLFAVAGHRVTIITTPSNAALLHKTTTPSAGGDISVHAIPFPAKEVGLPSGLENFFDAKDFNTATRLHAGMTLLSRDMDKFIAARRPDCVVSDMFHPWTAAASARLRIPRLVFHATCIFAMCLKDAVRSTDSPHLRVDSDYEPSQLPDYVRTPNGYTQMMEEWREAEMKSYGVLVNNFYELDSAYTEHYKKIMGHKIFHVGPAAMIHQNNGDKGRGEGKRRWWLMEIACGVEASTHQFIWVVFGKDNEESAQEKEEWLPKGFEERTKERGMIVKGWAPQVLILDHPSIGGFFDSLWCWGSVWKWGKWIGTLWVDAGKEVVKRENVERAVRKLMDSGDPAAGTRRQKAKELGEKARRAVQEGGSSHRDLTLLIEELKQLRDEREKLLGAAEALSYSAPT
ncbi:UDP-glucosyltransferase 73B2 [Actinidia rufa]|uniref:UDP-glucosyltransferase 73B2 n=1 Tax=Actinidia rufa TaxID=165716 RepID=A0A7J0G8D0_9ERIC|nr:UDP-glucosyltransferase 73B2 [Actinidia rufa]